MTLVESLEKYVKAVPEDTLTARTYKAAKAIPGLTYDQIYEEMGVSDSEDPDDYREAEDKWLTEHGF